MSTPFVKMDIKAFNRPVYTLYKQAIDARISSTLGILGDDDFRSRAEQLLKVYSDSLFNGDGETAKKAYLEFVAVATAYRCGKERPEAGRVSLKDSIKDAAQECDHDILIELTQQILGRREELNRMCTKALDDRSRQTVGSPEHQRLSGMCADLLDEKSVNDCFLSMTRDYLQEAHGIHWVDDAASKPTTPQAFSAAMQHFKAEFQARRDPVGDWKTKVQGLIDDLKREKTTCWFFKERKQHKIKALNMVLDALQNSSDLTQAIQRAKAVPGATKGFHNRTEKLLDGLKAAVDSGALGQASERGATPACPSATKGYEP